MIAHPKVVQRLNMMLGPGYQEAFEPMGCCYIPGTFLCTFSSFLCTFLCKVPGICKVPAVGVFTPAPAAASPAMKARWRLACQALR